MKMKTYRYKTKYPHFVWSVLMSDNNREYDPHVMAQLSAGLEIIRSFIPIISDHLEELPRIRLVRSSSRPNCWFGHPMNEAAEFIQYRYDGQYTKML